MMTSLYDLRIVWSLLVDYSRNRDHNNIHNHWGDRIKHMGYDNKESTYNNMTFEQAKRFLGFIMEDDLNFYEEYVIDLSDKEQERFFNENPDFMSEFPVGRDNIGLLKDKM